MPNNGGFLQRGLGFWTDGTAERLFVGTADAYLLSVDARTGKPDLAFGSAGKVDLTVGIRDAVRATNFTARRPLIAGNVVVVGNSIADQVFKKDQPPGYVHAFDVRTGKRLWTFNTVPKPGEFGYDTWLENSAEYTGSINVWASGIYDPELDYVYLPTSTPTNNYYGGHRLGNNLFAESLVCVEAKTGKRVWHFQAVHHGIWDYDFPTHPILGEITVNGRRIKAVIQVSKQGFTYVFDRRTGEPVWPIEERTVPAVQGAGRAHIANAAVSDETSAVRSSGQHRGEPDRLHSGVEGAGARAVEDIRARSALHAAVGDEVQHPHPWYRGRRELGWCRIRSRDRLSLRPISDSAFGDHVDSGRSEARKHALPASRFQRRRGTGIDRGPVDFQAALFAGYGHRSEQGRTCVDDPGGRRTARPFPAEGSQPCRLWANACRTSAFS